jgi:hypothetical protein
LVVEVVVIEEEVEVEVVEVEVVASHSGCLLRRGGSQVEKREAEQTTSEQYNMGVATLDTRERLSLRRRLL